VRLIAKAITLSRAKFHCNRLTTVQDIQNYVSLIFGAQCSSSGSRHDSNNITVMSRTRRTTLCPKNET